MSNSPGSGHDHHRRLEPRRGTTYISIGSGFVNSAADGTPNAPVGCMPVSVKG